MSRGIIAAELIIKDMQIERLQERLKMRDEYENEQSEFIAQLKEEIRRLRNQLTDYGMSLEDAK